MSGSGDRGPRDPQEPRGSLEGPPPPLPAQPRPTRRRAKPASTASTAETETTTRTGTRTGRTGRADRRQKARRRKRRLVGAGAVAAIVVATASAFAFLGGDDTKVKAAAPASSSTTTTAPAATTSEVPAATTATTKVPELQVFESPADGAPVVTTFADKTEYGLPRTLLVTEQQPGWLHALLPMRPNGSTGWVRESDVTLGSTTLSMKIELGAHKLTLYNGTEVALESSVVIGKKETPTPPGKYYVTDPVDLQSRPNGAYGAYALGISGYSEVLTSFNGGPGQLAVHGTANPDQVGQDISNGCIRVPNDVILQIVQAISTPSPLGVPVEILA